MDDLAVARAIHVLSVVMWIGGVAFVTTALMPAVRRNSLPAERLEAFHHFEERFAPQARIWVLLAGASGLWITWRADLWDRFESAEYWWMHAMVIVWLIFAAMLFVIEPFFLHRRMSRSPEPSGDFSRMERFHRIVLALSLITVIGATLGSHGFF